jgi:hypothetical protein
MLGLLAVGGVLSTTVELLLTVAEVTVSTARAIPLVRIKTNTARNAAKAIIKVL